MNVRIGDTINQYRITGRIGEGGMGVVYLADDTRLQRKVALKFVLNASLDSSEEIARFHVEARAAARLNHPNICTVYELGETDDKTYIAMEYVEGITLKQRMRQGHIEEADIKHWLKQIASGLQVAHEAGVIHRDIKPANIMITDKGLIKIMDFGIAKLAESETELTQANSTIGTIAYMSPEQARGESIDQRTDIWSVGVILYELATGQRPFTGAFREAIMYAMMHEDARAASELNPDLSDGLEQIIDRCLKRELEERYQSLEMLLRDLRGETAASATVRVVRELHPSETTQTTTVWSTLTASPVRRLVMGGALAAILLVLFMVPGLRNFLSPSSTSASLPAVMHMAVLPFDSISDDPEEESFSNGLAHLVATNLLRMEHDKEEFWIIPVREVLSRQVTSAGDARDKFGINLAVSGTIIELANTMQITLDVTDARTLRVIESETIELSETTPQAIQDQVMQKLALMLGLQSHTGAENQVIAGQTDDPEAYKLYIQGQGFIQQYQDQHNVDQAIQLFERAIDIDSTYALAYAGAGFAHARKYFFSKELKSIEQAVQRSEQALRLTDELAEVWVAAGRVRLDTGDTQEAINALEKATELEPDHYEAHRRLGTAYFRLGRFVEAERELSKAIALQPNYWDGYNMFAIILYDMGRIDETIAMFEKVIELAPESLWGYNNLANIYERRGNKSKAETLYAQSIAVNPSVLAYNNLARLVRKREDYTRALSLLKKAVKLSALDYQPWMMLGDTYYLTNQVDSARIAWTQSIELTEERLAQVNPKDPNMLSATVEAYAKLGRSEEAGTYLQRFLDLDRDNALSLLQLAFLYEYLDDRSNALIVLERALEKDADPEFYRGHPFLDGLFQDSDFEVLIEKYKH